MVVASVPDEKTRLAKAYLTLKGRSARSFAAYHGCSESWVYQVLSGRSPAPDVFKSDLATFLGVPESALFPADEEAAS